MSELKLAEVVVVVVMVVVEAGLEREMINMYM